MDAEILFWTKVAAIGQVAGAIATAAAVFVALLLSRAERQLRVRVSARFASIVDVHGQTEVMSYEVENIGLRPVVVHGMHWTTGWINRLGLLPKPLRLRSAFQLPDYAWGINKNFPWRLEPGETQSTHIRRQDFIDTMTEPVEGNLFRRLPWQRRPRLLNLRVGVAVVTKPRVVFGKVDPRLTAALNDQYEGE